MADIREYIKAAKGEIKADILIKNCKYADVFSKKFVEGDVAVFGEKIVGIGEGYNAERTIDAKGGYLCPGFIDSHLHIESSMVSPAEYAKVIMPKGVTTVIADPHEIANVCGEEGIDFMLESGKSTPLDIKFMIPSCVPAADFENAGAVLTSADVKRIIEKTGSIGLGEMMNYPGVLNLDDEVIGKLEGAEFSDGHAPLLNGKNLNGYIAAGIATDHECSNGEEMLEKLSKGMYIQLREGTCSKNLADLLPFVNEDNYDRCMFCSDDRYLGDIVREGTINYCIKKAVEAGIKPIYAVIMAGRNAALCYGLKYRGAIAPGYFADLVVIDDFENVNAITVIKNGKVVCDEGKLLFENNDGKLRDTVTRSVKRIDIDENSFNDNHKKGDKVTAIQIIPKSLITEKAQGTVGEDVSKVCVIERHKRKNNIAIGYVKGYDIKDGAVASTIGHDSHNIAVIGDNDNDMLKAVEGLGENGGICIASRGKVIKYLKLEIGGLMSARGFEEVLKEHNELHEAAKALQINSEIDPFMSLAFLPLPVIPKLRITDRGLFDVERFEFIEG